MSKTIDAPTPLVTNGPALAYCDEVSESYEDIGPCGHCDACVGTNLKRASEATFGTPPMPRLPIQGIVFVEDPPVPMRLTYTLGSRASRRQNHKKTSDKRGEEKPNPLTTEKNMSNATVSAAPAATTTSTQEAFTQKETAIAEKKPDTKVEAKTESAAERLAKRDPAPGRSIGLAAGMGVGVVAGSVGFGYLAHKSGGSTEETTAAAILGAYVGCIGGMGIGYTTGVIAEGVSNFLSDRKK